MPNSEQRQKPIRFEFEGPPYAQRVTIAGDFNSWNPNSHPLEKTPDGQWAIELSLPPGRHEYKFVVNDEAWMADPHAVESLRNDYGSENSVVDVQTA